MSDKKRILVLGDIIVDRYVYVTTERQCQEADDLPVWDVVRTELRLGGAANVARNLLAIADDVEVELAGLCDMKTFAQICDSRIDAHLITITNYAITKERIVQDGPWSLRRALVARIDDRKTWDVGYQERFESYMLDVDRSRYDAVIISDYRMGTISEKTARHFCENSPCRVFVDSKRSDLSRFRGAFVLKLNETEHSSQVSNRDYVVESLAQHVVVTLGAAGASVKTYENVPGRQERPTYITHTIAVPTEKVDVIDVTGCGDTFTAALTYFMTTKVDDVFTATKFANVCASKVVQKFGTETPK